MVFPGRLSKGCHVCRRRKVKCDGAKPECNRCIKHGIECTGYPDTFSFREYRPTQNTAESSTSPQRSGIAGSHLRLYRTRQSSYASDPSDASDAVSFVSGTHRQPEPSRALSVCTDWQSLCNFMNHVVLKVHKSPCEGHLAFLPDFFQEKGDNPCLKHALLSVSYLTLSNISGASDLHIKARLNYGQSLEHLNVALSTREDAMKDEILAACLLLSIFFNSVHEGGGYPDPHISGISHLLRLRGSEQATSKYTRYLIGWTITQIHIQAIGTNQFQYVKIPRYIEAMPNPDCVLRAGILNSMISQFCESASDAWSLPTHSSPGSESAKEAAFQTLLKRVPYLMKEIEIWNASIPPHWKRQYHLDSNILVPGSAPPSPDPWTITFLAITHSAQIVFYSHVLTCCDEVQIYDPEFSMSNFPGSMVEFCESIEDRIAILLETICYSVSSTIGFLDLNGAFQPMPTAKFANSNTLLWPMWTVVNCPFASSDQITLCRSALGFIGQAMGHKLAFSLSTQAPQLVNTGGG